jgi:hypothetical protein
MDHPDRRRPEDGPTLATYVETRLNLLTETLKDHVELTRQSLAALKIVLEAAQIAADLRYQQRFDAQSAAVNAAFASQQTAMSTALVTAEKAVLVAQAAADRAVSKAELAADKRFESVNEFRKTLDDQQRTLMPRPEVEVMVRGLTDKLATMKEQLDNVMSERAGIKGGWGYAVGVVGFLLALGSLVMIGMKVMGQP